MSDSVLIRARWNGAAFEPLPHYAKACNAVYVVGEIYDVESKRPRSMKSHSYFFARLHELWDSLPEDIATQYPSPEHLRKAMLIKIGHCDQRDFVCASNGAAIQLSGYLRELDEYSIVEVRGQVVRKWSAKSQSTRAQDRKEFETVKQRLLLEVEAMIGFTVAAESVPWSGDPHPHSHHEPHPDPSPDQDEPQPLDLAG